MKMFDIIKTILRFPVPRLSIGQLMALFWGGWIGGLGAAAQSQWTIDHPGRWSPLIGLLVALPYFSATVTMFYAAARLLGAKEPDVGPENDGVMLRSPNLVQNEHTRRF